MAADALTRPGHEGKAYELTGPEALSNAEVAEKLSAALGKTVRYADVEPEAFRDGARLAGLPEFYADALVDLQLFCVSGGAERVTGDIQKVTGRKPRSFDDFTREYVTAFRSEAA